VRSPAATADADRGRLLSGYALTAAAYTIFGLIGALVRMTTAPESVVLVIRMGLAAVILAGLFARRGLFADLRRPGVASRLLLMGALDASALMLFFIALRLTGVAVGMFLLFAAPVYVAFAAPRIFHQATDRVVFGALPLALVGLGFILVPGLTAEGLRVSALGLVAGVSGGVIFAAFLIVAKLLTRRVSNATFLVSECVLDTLFIAPLALWQWSGVAFRLTLHDLAVSVVLGVVCTALAYSLWFEGLRRVRVQHASIIGYLEPVTAPLYAYVLLAERPAGWALLGGALILGAGALIVLFGRSDVEAVPG
jgi:drug/metabolite transporter (DMT)-like permease